MPKDEVILVNELDQEIGTMDKVEAHRGEGKLHRAISVYLFRERSDSSGPELLIQQRSAQKIVGAGQWANTCCGNVRPGESYEDCAVRRLSEELGITGVELQPLYKFHYHVRCNDEFSEREIDQVFIGFYDEQPQPNPDEVATTDWVNWEKITNKKQRSQLGKDIAPWFAIMLDDQKLIDSLNHQLSL
ncbi:MAG TPA: isopentenyl-diphosphate Delta-isomerase [Vitreimonas sp.]|nr:isopentenyl-diphosphate Delta-isomerase [Vitreimonas sp.]